MDDEEIQKIENKGIRAYIDIVYYIADMNFYKNKRALGFVCNWLYKYD